MTAAAAEPIVIEAEPRELVHVTLVGKEYDITPPKAALAMRMAVEAKTAGDDPGRVFEVLNQWMTRAFGEKIADKVRARLEDEKDDLDLPHIMTLMEKVVEAQTGNPTS